MKKVDRQSASQYLWQEICDGWHLVERDDLSIIAEKMPPNTSEDMHPKAFPAFLFVLIISPFFSPVFHITSDSDIDHLHQK